MAGPSKAGGNVVWRNLIQDRPENVVRAFEGRRDYPLKPLQSRPTRDNGIGMDSCESLSRFNFSLIF